MSVRCSAIVHWEGGVVLVREDPKAKWRLPERELHRDEGPILCIRRCVLLETGFRAQSLRLFKIDAHGSDPKQAVRFVFGCQIEPAQLQVPPLEVASFEAGQILKLIEKKEFEDQLLMKIAHNFVNLMPTNPAYPTGPPYVD